MKFLACGAKYALPIMGVLISIGIAVYFVRAAGNRTVPQQEMILLQFFILLIGLGGSFWAGRQSAVGAARDILRPHARSAFRRVTSLYSGLSRTAGIIDECRDDDSPERYSVAFARLEELVRSQLITADDALEDWADIVPKDVRDLQRRLRNSEQGRE